MSARRERLAVFGGLVLVLALAAAAYSSSFSNGFLNWDDPVNVTQNRAIREFSVANARTWFSEPLLGMYSPLVYLSYALDYRIGGLAPAIYHATNLTLHLSCVVLVFAIVSTLTGRRGAAMAIAALFAVHPANVAAVTPISVRSSLLYATFYLGAYVAYLGHVAHPGTWRLVSALGLFVCAGLSKSAAAVFPLLLVLTDFYQGRRITRQVALEKVPFVAAALAIGIVTLALRTDVATADPLRTSALERAALAVYQFGFYAVKAIVPVNLSPFYPYPERAGDGSLPMLVWMAPALVLAGAWLVARAGTLRRPLAFGLLFFGVHLALVLKVVPLGEEFTADRYLYVPLVGLGVVAAELVSRLPRNSRRLALAAALVTATGWSAMTYARNADWRDDLSFNSRILDRYPRTATALANRAAARLQSGDVAGAWQDSTEAIRIDASSARAYFNRATAGMLSGRPAEALSDASRAIALDPGLPAAYELRAQARLNTGDYAGARDDASKAIELAPDGDEVFKSYVTRGLARALLNDGAGALADLNRAIVLNPGEPALLQNRGQIRITFGDREGGCADLRQAVARGRDAARALVTDLCGGAV